MKAERAERLSKLGKITLPKVWDQSDEDSASKKIAKIAFSYDSAKNECLKVKRIVYT
jgi:hypothetical protein